VSRLLSSSLWRYRPSAPLLGLPERFDEQGEHMQERDRRFAKIDAEPTTSLSQKRT